MSIWSIKDAVESFAPKESAEPWDNTGVLIDCSNDTAPKTVLLTIDLTDEVVAEAIRDGVSFIVSYHPVIFAPLRSIVDPRYVLCIQHGISVYSPHTQLDALMNAHLRTLVGSNVTLESALVTLRRMTGLCALRIVRGPDRLYTNSGDIVAGVGAAFKAPDFKNVLILTGEMSHHDLLRCKRNGCSVILLEHSNSERIFLSELKRLLGDALGGYSIAISKADRDPVEIATD